MIELGALVLLLGKAVLIFLAWATLTFVVMVGFGYLFSKIIKIPLDHGEE